ncbi:MAG: hypothetical protein II674_10010, partial [Prevotella sp.]|nr:hypothetical protein [Prevotella sp.]
GEYFAREFSGEKSKFEPLYLKALSITFPDKNISIIEKSVLYFDLLSFCANFANHIVCLEIIIIDLEI